MELVIGIAIGAAFSPFWMMLYNMLAKPYVDKLFKSKSEQ